MLFGEFGNLPDVVSSDTKVTFAYGPVPPSVKLATLNMYAPSVSTVIVTDVVEVKPLPTTSFLDGLGIKVSV